MPIRSIILFSVACGSCGTTNQDEYFQEAWFNLGLSGGGSVKVSVKVPEGGSVKVAKHFSEKSCYQKALEVDGKASKSFLQSCWYCLGVEGGGMVKSVKYSKKDCYQKALENGQNHSDAWFNLGVRRGGTLGEKRTNGVIQVVRYSGHQCYQKTLEIDEAYKEAWLNLGALGGGIVKQVR